MTPEIIDFCRNQLDAVETDWNEKGRLDEGQISFLIRMARSYFEATALRSTPEAGDQGAWRPIESAPKDGTHILITRPSEWREDRHHVVAWGDWMAGRADEWWLVHDGKEDHPLRGPDPTHWMPLPSPLPTQSNTGGHREGPAR